MTGFLQTSKAKTSSGLSFYSIHCGSPQCLSITKLGSLNLFKSCFHPSFLARFRIVKNIRWPTSKPVKKFTDEHLREAGGLPKTFSLPTGKSINLIRHQSITNDFSSSSGKSTSDYVKSLAIHAGLEGEYSFFSGSSKEEPRYLMSTPESHISLPVTTSSCRPFSKLADSSGTASNPLWKQLIPEVWYSSRAVYHHRWSGSKVGDRVDESWILEIQRSPLCGN